VFLPVSYFKVSTACSLRNEHCKCHVASSAAAVQFSSGISLNFELNCWFRFKRGLNKNQIQNILKSYNTADRDIKTDLYCKVKWIAEGENIGPKLPN
jgi:hypothetical protein